MRSQVMTWGSFFVIDDGHLAQKEVRACEFS